MRRPRVRFPRQRMLILTLGVPATAAGLVAALLLSAAQAIPRGGVSLLETLSEWKYPDSNMLGGADMSDLGYLHNVKIPCFPEVNRGRLCLRSPVGLHSCRSVRRVAPI